MYQRIINLATETQKNILILGSPRSGTHPLASELAEISGGRSLGELCKVGYCNDPWKDIDKLSNNLSLIIGQVVQLTPKLILAEDVDRIKNQNIIVNIKRQNKVEQFASWIYFRVLDPTGLHGWHNHSKEKTKFAPGSFEASEQDIIQFKLEQVIDDYFLPDFKLCYEDLTFNTQRRWQKNQFAFYLPEIFSNLEFVKQKLEHWTYSSQHFTNE